MVIYHCIAIYLSIYHYMVIYHCIAHTNKALPGEQMRLRSSAIRMRTQNTGTPLPMIKMPKSPAQMRVK